MNLTELIELIRSGENERLEFKKSTGQRTDAAKTVCAMLNGLGGFVLFGISDRGEIIGQHVSANTLNDIAHELGRIEPPAILDMKTIALQNGKSVIVLNISAGGGPYVYDGRPYARHGSTTQRMPQQRYERMLLERMHAKHRWENQPTEGISLKDLDRSEITRTVEEAIRRQRMEEPGTRNAHNILMGLGLIEEDQLLNAAVVLFGKTDKFLPNYSQCLLKMARFRGTDKSEFIDNRQEYGNAFDLFQRAQRFIRDHVPVAGRIIPSVFERIDDPLYPPAALREALANALCHRDYSIGGGAISLAIYDDRLEISSTGELPFGLTPEMLAKPHASRPWNPLIAQTFYRRGIIEIWGRGTNKIIELTEQAGLPTPEFESYTGEFLIRFRLGKGALKARQVGSRAESGAESGAESTGLKILRLLSEKECSKSEIANILGQNTITGFLNRMMNKLIKDGMITRTLPDKPMSRLQKYRIAPAGLAELRRFQQY